MSFLNTIAPRQPVSVQSQIAQIKSAGQSTVTPSTQGVPKVVSDVTVRKKVLNSTQVQLTVTFTENPNDIYFTHVEIYLKLGTANPVLIGQGVSSPLDVTVSQSDSPATIIVVSAGNWGRTDVDSSPATSLSLSGNSAGSSDSLRVPQFYQATGGLTTLNASTYTNIATVTFTLPNTNGLWRLLFTAKYYMSEVAGGNAIDIFTRVTDGTGFTNTDSDGEATVASGNVLGIKFFDWWGVLLGSGVTKTYRLQAIASNAADTYQANGIVFTVMAFPS